MQQLVTKPATPNGWQPGRGSGRSAGAVRYRQDNSITLRNTKGQVVGRLQDGWLVKRVDTRVHQLRVPPAWCCDVAHIEHLWRIGGRGVKLIDEKGRIWTAPLARWEGLRTMNRGHGPQYVLPSDRWDVEDPAGPRQLELLEAV